METPFRSLSRAKSPQPHHRCQEKSHCNLARAAATWSIWHLIFSRGVGSFGCATDCGARDAGFRGTKDDSQSQNTQIPPPCVRFSGERHLLSRRGNTNEQMRDGTSTLTPFGTGPTDSETRPAGGRKQVTADSDFFSSVQGYLYMNRIVSIAAILSVVLCMTARSTAGTIVASDAGFYFDTGFHSSTSENYDSDGVTHDFFVFNLAGVSGTVTSASLMIFNPPVGYSGPSAGLPFDVFDVSTGVSALEASHASNDPSGVTIYNDLGSGTLYGTQTVSQADDNNYVTVNLDSAALAAINAAVGQEIAFGGALQSPSSTEFIFGFSNTADVNQLVIDTSATSTPEPSTATLFALAATGFCGYSVRRRGRGSRP